MLIRAPRQDDLPALVAIYNHYVTTSHITFDVESITVEQRRPWFVEFSESGPQRLLLGERDGRVVGYASSTTFRPKPAYRTSVETTIYLDPKHTGLGFGQVLYGALLDVLDQSPGVHRAYGGVALPNPASIALHEKLGFHLVGTLREVGRKFDKYWDVSWFERDCRGRTS